VFSQPSITTSKEIAEVDFQPTSETDWTGVLFCRELTENGKIFPVSRDTFYRSQISEVTHLMI
jgi:hypothetical protein